MSERKHPCPKMRSTSSGRGFHYHSGPMSELHERLVAEQNAIFRAATDGFQQRGRGAVLWPETAFIPQAELVAEIGDPYATKCIGDYSVGRSALVYVRRPDGAALFELSAHYHRVRRGPRQPILGDAPQAPVPPPKKTRVLTVQAPVLWSRGFAASAAAAERRAS